MFRWFKQLFKGKEQPIVLQKEVVKEIVKVPCWKHEKFKKGCPTCRNLNNGS